MCIPKIAGFFTCLERGSIMMSKFVLDSERRTVYEKGELPITFARPNQGIESTAGTFRNEWFKL